VATSSFPEQAPYNNEERLMFIAIIYIGDAGFALVFALIAASSAVFPQKFNAIFKNIRRLGLTINKACISKHLTKVYSFKFS
jgi:hypothetical protein